MKIDIKRKGRIRLVAYGTIVEYEDHTRSNTVDCYKVQLRVFNCWVTIKSFEADDYNDAVECFKYCTDPYKID